MAHHDGCYRARDSCLDLRSPLGFGRFGNARAECRSPVRTSYSSQAVAGGRPTRTAIRRARDSKAALSAFRRVRVGKNEIDYIAEDVTIRLFTPGPTPAQVPHLIRELNIGEDVTVRYFAYKPHLAPQTRPDSAAAQSVERSLSTSK